MPANRRPVGIAAPGAIPAPVPGSGCRRVLAFFDLQPASREWKEIKAECQGDPPSSAADAATGCCHWLWVVIRSDPRNLPFRVREKHRHHHPSRTRGVQDGKGRSCHSSLRSGKFHFAGSSRPVILSFTPGRERSIISGLMRARSTSSRRPSPSVPATTSRTARDDADAPGCEQDERAGRVDAKTLHECLEDGFVRNAPLTIPPSCAAIPRVPPGLVGPVRGDGVVDVWTAPILAKGLISFAFSPFG